MSKKKNELGPTPRNLEEAFAILDKVVSDKDKTAIISGEDCHFSLGLFIRNSWYYDADCEELLADVQRAVNGEDGVLAGPDGKVMFMGDGDAFSSSVIDLYREHLIKASYEIEYNESVFHIFGIPSDININKLCEDAGKYCSDEGFSGEIRTFVTDEQKEIEKDSDGPQVCTAVLLGASAQGVEITYFYNPQNAHLHLRLPTFGSPGDVKLAFAVMEQLKEQYPDCGIFYNDNTEGEFGLVEQNYDAILQMCFGNLASIIEASAGGKHPVIQGFQYEFVLPSPDDDPEKTYQGLVLESMHTLIALQWDYTDISRASRANVTSPEGEQYMMRILTNSCDTFVGICDRLALYGPGQKIKEVEPLDFIKYMEGNQYFERVDFLQFVIRKMPAKEWNKIFDSIEGKILA